MPGAESLSLSSTKYWIWQTIHQIYTKPIVFGTLCLAIAPRYTCLGSLGFYLAGLVPPGHTAAYPTLGCWAQHDWGKEPQVLYLQLWDVICTTSTCYWEPWRSTQQSTSGVAYHGMVSGFAAGGSYSLPLPFKSALSEWLAVAEDSPSIRTWWWIPSSGVILKRLCSRMLQLASWGIMRSWESIRYDTYWYITYPQASGSQDLVGC